MINIKRFLHEDITGKKYIFNSDLLKLNIDNKEYNSLKRFLKRNKIEVIITEKERKDVIIKNYTAKDNIDAFNELRNSDDKYKRVVRNKIIKGNIHIANFLVFKSFINYKIDYEEYSSYAYEALMESVDNFLISGEEIFYEYASKCITNKLNSIIRKETGMNSNTYLKYLSIKEEIEKDIDNSIDDEYYKIILDIMLSRKYIDEKEYKNLLDKNNEEIIDDDTLYPFESDLKKLDFVLSNIKVKFENLIRLNYGIGEKRYTLQQVADKLGCTRSNIGQQLSYAVDELKSYIHNNYNKNESYELVQLIRNSNYSTDTSIIDYPYSKNNINTLFNKYISGKEINRYELRLFDVNKKFVMEEALTGNDKAMFLALRSDILLKEHNKWISVNNAKSYYYNNYQVDGYNMFNFNSIVSKDTTYAKKIDELFITLKLRKFNIREIKWLKDNKQLLLKNATSGDLKAMYICLRTFDEDTSTMFITPTEAINYYSFNTEVEGLKLYDNIKSGLSITMGINLLFDYYKEYGHIPNYEEQNNTFGTTFNVYKNKEYIISMALKGNDKAMFLCLRLFDDRKPWISREEAKKVFPERYSIDDLNMYKNDICDRSINKSINLIFNTLKSYGGLTRKSNVVLINKYKIKLDDWVESNKDLLLKEIFSMNSKAAYIVLHSKCTPIISIKELLKHYPIDTKVDGIMLYSDLDFYDKDSINVLYNYYVTYNTFVQDSVTKKTIGIDIKKIFIQNKEIIYNEVKRNNSKAKLVYSEALKAFNDKVLNYSVRSKDILQVIHNVYEDYMIKGIYPNKNKSEYGIWLSKHQNDLIIEAQNKNLEACEILRFYKDNYIEISSINSLALKLCLDNNWLLRKEVRCNANYYRLKKYEEKIKRLGK